MNALDLFPRPAPPAATGRASIDGSHEEAPNSEHCENAYERSDENVATYSRRKKPRELGGGLPTRDDFSTSISPYFGLFNILAQPERDQGREDTDEKSATPAPMRKYDSGNGRGQSEANGKTALHDAERFAAMLLRPGL